MPYFGKEDMGDQLQRAVASRDCRESIPNRIVSISKPYVRPFSEEKKEKDLVK